MIVSIILQKPHGVFTNLDEVAGKVVLRAPSGGTVTSITVKLEGESKSRLADAADKKRDSFELHKLLYKLEVVFPPPALQDDTLDRKGYTLPAGIHEYPFKFKIPFNNSCHTVQNPSRSIFNELASPILSHQPHTKATLPPSMSGFPGEADISYFVKATVGRPKFFTENLRASTYITFMPIEPPSKKQSGQAYARRQHQFVKRPKSPSQPPQPARSSSMFSSRKNSSTNVVPTPETPAEDTTEEVPARVSAELRLPNPAELTCNQTLPLKIIIKRLSSSSEQLYLQSLQIELIGYTKVRAQLLDRKESTGWVIISQSNMGLPLGSPSDPIGTETPISPSLWQDHQLPNTVAPSFTTCNIAREYELQVLVGLGYATTQSGKDQFVVLPLRLPIAVLSGIKPPKALLAAMENRASASGSNYEDAPITGPPPQPPRPFMIPRRATTGLSPQSAATAATGEALSSQQAAASSSSDAPPPTYDEPPPSYEDAMGLSMPPVEGPRGNYEPPPSSGDDARFRDSKR